MSTHADLPSTDSPGPGSSLAGADFDREDRASFGAAELAVALSHFDLGVISSIRPFDRGSTRSPKVIVTAASGVYLFKRRASGRRNDPTRVALSHDLSIHLADRGYPVARLIGTRREDNTILMIGEHIYELFEFIEGDRYNHRPEAAHAAGRALAIFHAMTADFVPRWEPPTSHYHRSHRTETYLRQIPERLGKASRERVALLTQAVHDAADQADRHGASEWPARILHGDWHPGNMLFRGDQIAAVIDLDTVRLGARMLDVANGALQFSLTRGGEAGGGEADQWPAEPDLPCLEQFLRGYETVESEVLSDSELAALPWLMIEALVLETVGPIATTGRFGRMQGGPFLQMIERKVRWLLDRAEQITTMAG